MAKTVKRKVNKKPDASLKIETPYPEGEKAKQQKSDTDYWGEKMVKLQDRINELELSLNDISVKLKVVTGRMGL
tara:strand:+ start:260 stop:481 length:222 start_codon:yes stop_codon:yes gene_type:complete